LPYFGGPWQILFVSTGFLHHAVHFLVQNGTVFHLLFARYFKKLIFFQDRLLISGISCARDTPGVPGLEKIAGHGYLEVAAYWRSFNLTGQYVRQRRKSERFTNETSEPLRKDLPANPCRETGEGGLCPPPAHEAQAKPRFAVKRRRERFKSKMF
jgi:hypothetical protein